MRNKQNGRTNDKAAHEGGGKGKVLPMAKMIKCRTCGQMIAKNAKTCPTCGAPNNYMPVWARIAITVVTVIMLVSVLDILLSDTRTDYGSDKGPDVQVMETGGGEESAAAPAEQTADPGPAAEQDTSRVLYDGENMKATLVRIYEDDITKSIGAIGVVFEFENRSSVPCDFYMHEVAVNDYNVMPLGGNPFATKPGEKVKEGFTLGLGATDAGSLADVFSVKFSLQQLEDGHMSNVLTQTERYEVTP